MTQSRNQNRKTRLTLERLESRELLAGMLTITRVGGEYLLAGTDGAEEFKIQSQSTAGSFKVIGLNNTKINGAAESTLTGVSSLNLLLRGGDDTASLDMSVNSIFNLPGSFTFNGGEGNNSLVVGGLLAPVGNSVRIGGSLVVSGGSGKDTVSIQAGGETIVQGLASFNFGNGESNLMASKLTVHGGGGLTINAYQGNDVVNLGGLSVARDVEMNLGTGKVNVTINGNAGVFQPTVPSKIGGNLTVNAYGTDGTVSVYNDLAVNGSVNANLGEFGSMILGSGNITVNSIYVSAKNLSVSTLGMLTVKNNVTFAGGTATVVDIHGSTKIEGDLTWYGGNGGLGNRFSVGAFSTSPIFIGGNANFISGRSELNEISIQSTATNPGSVIAGDFKVIGSSGTDNVTLDNVNVKRNVNVALGSGQNRLTLGQGIGQVSIGGFLTIDSGEGRDNVQFLRAIVSKLTSINLGDGVDTVNIADSTFNAFYLYTGNGDDVVNMESGSLGTQGLSRFLGAVYVDLGRGNDKLRIGSKSAVPPRSVAFAVDAVFSGGHGLNDFDSIDAKYTGSPRFFYFGTSTTGNSG